MSEDNLPKEWIKVSLDDVLLSIVGGGTPSKSNASYFQGDIPWMSVKDMNKNILENTIDHITQSAVENSSTNIIPAGTPIIATRMSLGKVIIANFDTAINQDLKALFLASGIERDYLIGWYRSISKHIESLGTGTTVKGIRLEVLKALQFPLPPLAEQKIICDKLNILLPKVEIAKEKLESIPETLKRFRQSVLTAAVCGKLTERWRHAASSNWRTMLLSEICRSISDGDHQAPPKADEGIPFLVISNVSSGVIDFNSVNKWVPKSYYESLKDIRKPECNDILYTVTGSFGIPVIVSTSRKFCFQRHIAIIKPNSVLVNSKFLAFLLASPNVYKYAESVATGTAQKTVSLMHLRRFPVELPPLAEQNEIVCRIEELFTFADSIDRKVKKALDRVNNLTQSILTKAFRGELTSNWRISNSDLINGENSAKSLLYNIKLEREMFNKLPKTKRTKIDLESGGCMNKETIKVVEVLKKAGKPLSGQQLLAAAGYPNDCSTEELERFFLDLRESLTNQKSITRLERSDDGQDWFSLTDSQL
ncbi:specificity determinant for hsdM and hsdR [Salmonella enterica]|nr:specificity determinant for hsdM and hsdR [Salmonella enterica]EDO1572773.1 specificity determinant for hsdM and hsdR [Salmonella enterica subsp. enterica serovar Javiana]MBN4859122.1 restriction endonuclease subunit S [Citrobacter freundii]EDG4101412.1 specificity determinant for hsdM and hsdR [Salmonella enterica]EDY0094664.1 specificity determinant for hsdM and hsdR [Salmonella enterica]